MNTTDARPRLGRAWVVHVLVLVLGVLGAVTPRAWAQAGSEVRVEFKLGRAEAAAGEVVPLAVIFDHAEGWHIHTQAPKPPKGVPDGVLIPTVIEVAAPAGVQVGAVQWPKTKTTQVDLSGSGRFSPYEVFAGRAVALVPIRVPAGAAAGTTISLPVTASFQACDDTTCLPPDSASGVVTLTVAASSSTGAITDADFAAWDASKATFDTPGGSVPKAGERTTSTSGGSPAGQTPSASSGTTSSAPGASFFGLSISGLTGTTGLLVLALLGAAGGFVLNLTPCVLPVIPIKIMTLTQGAGDGRKSLVLGLWMSLGVFAFWLGLGILAVSVTAWADPSRVFGIWWVTAGIGAIIGVMALGIMGLFSINLPQAVYAVNPNAKSPGGSFLFGVMTAVLGLPCFGFVAGALLPAAAALGPTGTIAVFAAMGVGMALPYGVLAAKPSWIERIPRTGPASELVKQVMGLLLLAAAAFFVGSGLLALVQDRPYMGKVLHWWAVAGLGTIAALWLIVRTFQITPRAGRRGVFSVIGVAIAGLGLWAASSFTARERTDYATLLAAREQSAGSQDLVPGIWNPYNPAAIERALASGQVVVMDFTAEWCLNCKALKAAVLDVDPVRSALQERGILKVEVDLTSQNAPGWKRLRELGQTGIPLLSVQGPGLSEPWLSNAYTSAQVIEALGRARGEGGGAVGGGGARAEGAGR